MKKLIVFVLCLTFSFGILAESAFAASSLETKVNSLIGTDYVYGGTTTKGFDCSGFTMYVFNQFGIDLNHSSRAQSEDGTAVSKKNLRAGDLVFFDTDGAVTSGGISHVGIYLGDGVFVHASTNKGVIKNKLSEDYYAKRYVTARRILSDDQYEKIATE
ncbi:C40 family peptidase [Gorillibacterium massiliense]|uniref:C40 family peptidase n=1 Tax=Gorillibacterium massiliense TaxID=1280390 RepID=UPI0004B0B206|nr:C40 family peptidase [Gorillibacterium massiliense]